MNRRELLKLLLAGAAGLTLDTEKLLWVPGAKTIFIPSQKQLDYFYGGRNGGGKTLSSLYGIPYHFLTEVPFRIVRI